MTDNFKEIGSLFGREGAGAGFAKSGRNALAADAPARDAPGKDNQNIG